MIIVGISAGIVNRAGRANDDPTGCVVRRSFGEGASVRGEVKSATNVPDLGGQRGPFVIVDEESAMT